MTSPLALLHRLRINRPASAAALACFTAWSLSGCTSMSGLGGSSSYACKAPEGVTCDSVAGTYANAMQNNLPSQRRPSSAGTGTSPATRATMAVASLAAWATTGGAASHIPVASSTAPTPLTMPLRSSARILRLWIKPWEDADRDLHNQGYVYIRVDDGQWLVEHVQRQIRDAYAPLRPPARAAGMAPETRDAATAIQPPRAPSPPSLPGLTPAAGRPQTAIDPTGND